MVVHVTESWEDQGHGSEYTRTISPLRGYIVSSTASLTRIMRIRVKPCKLKFDTYHEDSEVLSASLCRFFMLFLLVSRAAER